VPILASPVLAAAGFAHAFPTRDVTDAELLAHVCPGGAAVVQARQVHGRVAVLAENARGAEADAVIAREGAVAVGVRVADCVPVLVGDETSGNVAAIHAGWRGVEAGVVPAGVELLAGDRLVAAIGPCIGGCCFEVGEDVAARIGFVVRRQGDKAFVDLRAAVRAQLRALGVDDARIDDVPGCTKHEPDRFHSFRRDGANSGRMLAAIARRGARAISSTP
jgi:purine-nucleoside/S-methyl-5'-thioadenosine phosphorylase / adenosine deaminase